MIRALGLASATAIVALTLCGPASALTMKECGVKYQAAKKSNALKGMKWNDFRKAECGDDDASDADAAAAVTDAAPSAAAPAKPAAPAAAPATTPAATAAAPKPVGRIVYPRVVDPKFANESAGKARLLTCAQQYNANKAAKANGGLVWIQAGGGYWSLCNTRLKGG